MYWGRHFSPRYWKRHFDRDPGLLAGYIPDLTSLVQPPGPKGVGALALVLEQGASVQYSYSSQIFSSIDGTERRAEALSLPVERYQGSALLVDSPVRRNRALLQRYAAKGSIFRLGIPWEELSILDDVAAKIVTVKSTLARDWCNPGQMVILLSPDDEISFETYVQNVTATAIYLNDAPGEGFSQGRIMPSAPVYLDPRQSFQRYPRATVETWQITARNAFFGYRSSPRQATLALSVAIGSLGSHRLDGVYLVARLIGEDGNDIAVTFDGSYTGSSAWNYTQIIEDVDARTCVVMFKADVTTIQGLIGSIMANSQLIFIGGSYVPTDAVRLIDGFSGVHLSGGVGSATRTFGRGATVAEYASRPVWDYRLVIDGNTLGDSMQSLAETVDLGGVPVGVGLVKNPAWGRQIFVRTSDLELQQWIKLFLDTVKGRRRAFWLPTWRADFLPLSVAPGAAGVPAALPLAAADSAGTGIFDGLTVTSTSLDASVGNNTYLSIAPGATFAGDVSTSTTGTSWFVSVIYNPGITDVQRIVDLINSTSLMTCAGSYTALDRVGFEDQFGDTALYGGVSPIAAIITCDGTDDLMAFRPDYDRIQILQEDGTITYAQILYSADNGDGTVTISIDETLSAEEIELISWLEVVRFESDQFQITYGANKLSFSAVARVVPA